MAQIQISASLSLDGKKGNYDPLLCKTCQEQASPKPQPARAPYSDCEEHFHERVTNLLLTGGLTIV